MAQVAYQYCTGAVDVFVAPNVNSLYVFSPPNPSSALYVGTCEQYPVVQGVQEWQPTFNDIAGTKPFDKQYFGDSKILVLDINKMVEATIEGLIDFGIETVITRGLYKNLTAAIAESFTLWLSFRLFGTAAAIPGLPPGEVYFNCSVAESDYDPIGTRSRKTRLVVEADPAYTANNALSNGGRGFVTYSVDPTFFSGLPSVA